MKLLLSWKKYLHNQRGSVIVLLAVGLTVLLAGVALVTDIGLNYVIQGRLSVAADAAALAGGTKLKNGRDEVRRAAVEVAAKNGVSVDWLVVDVDDNVMGLTVTTKAPMQLFFARIFGAEGGVMEQRARVAMTRPVAFMNVFPLGVDEKVTLDYNKRLNLFSQELLGSGNWGALQFMLNGKYQTGASVLRENLKYGFAGIVNIGDVANTESGVSMGPISESITFRMSEAAKDHQCSLYTCPADCPRILIMPIYAEILDNNSNKTGKVDIVDFAAFYVESISGGGANTQIWGYFIRPIVKSAASVEGESKYGLTSIKLIQ
jgi:Flp pilus assembly protein TadG